MKKWIVFFLLALTSYGQCKGFVSLKPSYFYPQDKVYREIYKGGFLPLLEVGIYVTPRFFLSVEGGYFYKREELTSFDITAPSKVTQIPASLYLGYGCLIKKCINVYGKIGPNGIYTKTHDEILGLAPVKKKYTFGASISLGMKYYFYKRLYAEAFCNYLYNKKGVYESGDHFFVYLGGMQLGAGLGWCF